MITVEDLKDWFKEGRKKKAKFMLVVCDTFDYEDFRVYCKDKNEKERKLSHYIGQSMYRVMEVYDLSKPFDKQPKCGKFAWAV